MKCPPSANAIFTRSIYIGQKRKEANRVNGLLLFVEKHWLSFVLIAGALAAIWFVYKERSKLMLKDDE